MSKVFTALSVLRALANPDWRSRHAADRAPTTRGA